MKRRRFITLLGGAAAAWPLAVRAQQVSTRRPLVAVLSAVTRERNLPLNAFVQGMREFGYVEGQNIDIEYRFAEGRLDRFPQAIPIVCPLLADPIHFGLIASESRPGGNVTGVLFRTEGLKGFPAEVNRGFPR